MIVPFKVVQDFYLTLLYLTGYIVLGYQMMYLGNKIVTWSQDIARVTRYKEQLLLDLPELLLRKLATRRDCDNPGGFSSDRQCTTSG